MKTIHQLEQGSESWSQFRSKHFGASEASAMLGLSPYKTRSDLLKEKSTGIKPEVSDFTQTIFNRGHQAESLARNVVETLLDVELYPVVYSLDDLSASVDGISICETVVWETKQLNAKLFESVKNGILPEHHKPQCQQVLYVTSAEKLYFTCSDGTEEKTIGMWVYPDEVWFSRIVAGWEQFKSDLDMYEHKEIAEPAKSEPIKDLPAVIVQVSGALERCNINEVKPLFDKFLANAITELVTDEDFAQAEAESKIGRETAKRCVATAKSVVDQTLSISAVTRELENYAAKFNAIALLQEKAVKTQKEARRVSAKNEREKAFKEHILALQAEIKPIVLMVDNPDWNAAMKNQRLLSSLYSKLDDALADGKIRSDAAAKDIRTKLAWIYGNGFDDYKFLFNDLQSIIYKPFDDFRLMYDSRINKHIEDEADKREAQRLQIQAEEQRKAEDIQQQKLESERAAIREEERVKASKIMQEGVLKAKQEAEFNRSLEALSIPKTQVSMQQIDTLIAQKKLREDDRKNPPVVKQRPPDEKIISLIANSFFISKEVALIWITDIATKQLLNKVA